MSDVTLNSGSAGKGVKELQEVLTALGYDPGPADGTFGGRTEAAVRQFQLDNVANVKVDGTVGPQTWRALNEAATTETTLRPGDQSTAVRRLQSLLTRSGFDIGPIDGQLGPRTEAAVKVLQDKHGLSTDGVVGPETWRAINSLAPLPD